MHNISNPIFMLKLKYHTTTYLNCRYKILNSIEKKKMIGETFKTIKFKIE